jgi:O-antigen ligase
MMSSTGVRAGPWHRLGPLLIVAATAYLALGKPLAYLRVGPIYVGEMLLFSLLAVTALRVHVMVRGIPVPLVLLTGYTGAQILVGVIGNESLYESVRNWAVVYYALFAFVACVVVTSIDRRSLDSLSRWLPRLGLSALVAIFCLVVLKFVGIAFLPVLGAPVPVYKPTDASIAVLLVLVMWTRHYVSAAVAALLCVPLLIMLISQSRSVMLAFVAVAILFSARRRLQGAVLALLLCLLLAAVLDLRVETGYREVSARQVAVNLVSVASSGSYDDKSLSSNRSWRLDWWKAIYADARDKQFVFAGAGWDSNLADKFGFQTASATSVTRLRDPHSVLFGLLGRAGFLVVVLWMWTYLAVILRLLRRRRLLRPADAILVDLGLVAALAGLVHGLTDVFLESPQNAIPHWILIGAALGVVNRSKAVKSRQPDAELAVV